MNLCHYLSLDYEQFEKRAHIFSEDNEDRSVVKEFSFVAAAVKKFNHKSLQTIR